jgi:hypothetical protein
MPAKPRGSSEERFTEPKPNPLLMRLSGYLSEWLLLQGVPGLRHVPLLRDLPGIGGYFKVRKIVIPAEDDAVIRATTDPRNVFFIGPNHPEFTTDWLIDKYISMRYAPRISCWAAASIIAGPLKSFWLANNLIGNNGGERAKAYSIASALRGDGTLLHPEGAVRWRGDKVFDLLPGIVDMGIEAVRQVQAAGGTRRVYILPLLWRLRYDESIEGALQRDLGRLERVLRLPSNPQHGVMERYVALHQNLLRAQMDRFGFDHTHPNPDPDTNTARQFFEAQLGQLQATYPIEYERENIHRTLHRFYRAAREAGNSLDVERVLELQRLASYSPETFERGFFYQEEIAEGLQMLKQVFLTKGYDSVRSFLPKPFGWRTAIIVAAEPIDVTQVVAERGGSPEVASDLVAELQARMERRLKRLTDEWASQQRFEKSSP